MFRAFYGKDPEVAPLLHNLGLDDMTSFGDSTGEFSLALPSTTAAI